MCTTFLSSIIYDKVIVICTQGNHFDSSGIRIILQLIDDQNLKINISTSNNISYAVRLINIQESLSHIYSLLS